MLAMGTAGPVTVRPLRCKAGREPLPGSARSVVG